jgi:hypothetical protein
VAGGETYYAADELVNYKWKVTGELSRNSLRPDREGRMDIFWRSAAHWIIATNMPAVSNYARLVSMGTTTFGRTPGASIARPDLLVMVFRRERPRDLRDEFDGPTDLRIIDEQGRSYRHTFYTETDRTIRYTFFDFPRSAKTWQLIVYASPLRHGQAEQKILFAFAVTNLVATPKSDDAAKEVSIEAGQHAK